MIVPVCKNFEQNIRQDHRFQKHDDDDDDDDNKMAHRLIMKVLFTGSQVFGRAFAEAYKQSSSASLKQRASAAAQQKAGGVSLDEACKILDVDAGNLSKEAVQKKYDHLFDVNSKDKSGSFYLQSKVYRAQQRVQLELDTRAEKSHGGGGGGTSQGEAKA